MPVVGRILRRVKEKKRAVWSGMQSYVGARQQNISL